MKAREYRLNGWIPNPYFLGFQRKRLKIDEDQVLMVSRLDGPNEKVVKIIIDETIETERAGLKCKAYFDVRWPELQSQKVKKLWEEGVLFLCRYKVGGFQCNTMTEILVSTI